MSKPDFLEQHPATAAQLSTLSSRGRAAFAAGCAERARPVFDHFAAAASRPVFSAVLEGLWTAVDSRKLRPIPAVGPLTKLPEGRILDSRDNRSFAMNAIAVLAEALRCLRRGANVEETHQVVMTALNLFAELGSVFHENFPRPVAISSANPPPPSELEQGEIDRQQRDLRFLSGEDEPDSRAYRRIAITFEVPIGPTLKDVERRCRDAGFS